MGVRVRLRFKKNGRVRITVEKKGKDEREKDD